MKATPVICQRCGMSPCTCHPVNAVNAEREAACAYLEREAICSYLEHKGQRVMADRIRRGEHHHPHAVASAPAPRPRVGMEEGRNWDEEDGA